MQKADLHCLATHILEVAESGNFRYGFFFPLKPSPSSYDHVCVSYIALSVM